MLFIWFQTVNSNLTGGEAAGQGDAKGPPFSLRRSPFIVRIFLPELYFAADAVPAFLALRTHRTAPSTVSRPKKAAAQ